MLPHRYDGHVAIRTLLSMLLGFLVVVGLQTPAHAADEPFSVRIDAVSPFMQTKDGKITVSGTITNNSDDVWRDVHAYFVAPNWPLTSRHEVENLLTNPNTTVGTRVVELDQFEILGDIEPKSSLRFTLVVPSSSLNLPAISGVLPVGVQILATAPNGERDTTALARASTVVPRLDRKTRSVPTGIVWQFVPTWSIAKPKPESLAESVTNGRLRNLLNAAESIPAGARSLLIDPAIIDELLAIAADPKTSQISPEQAESIQVWIDDLLRLARSSDTWLCNYGTPDLLAFYRVDAPVELRETLRRADRTASETHSLVGTPIACPGPKDTTADLLNSLVADGANSVLVNSARLNGWSAELGSVVTHETGVGTADLIVNTPAATSDRNQTAATVRQQVIAMAALASIERVTTRNAKSDALFFIDPRWDPGRTGGHALSEVFDLQSSNSPIRAATLTDIVRDRPRAFGGTVASKTPVTPLPSRLTDAVREHERLVALTSELITDRSTRETGSLNSIRGLSMRWRADPGQATSWIDARSDELRDFLEDLQIEAPRSITLSGSSGVFPLTLLNGTSQTVRLGLELRPDRTGVEFKEPETITIEPGERKTLSVEVEMDRHVSTAVQVRMTTAEGTGFGENIAFVVRSSRVGITVWAVMGAAVLLVIATWARRFLNKPPRPQGRPTHE